MLTIYKIAVIETFGLFEFIKYYLVYEIYEIYEQAFHRLMDIIIKYFLLYIKHILIATKYEKQHYHM